MKAPARVGSRPRRSTKAGACDSAVTTDAWAETSTRSPRPVASRWESATSAPMAACAPAQPYDCGPLPTRPAGGRAGGRRGAARRHELDVPRLPRGARTDAAERPDGDDHQPRVILPQRMGIERRAGDGWREQADVGRPQQILELRPVG